MVPRVIDSLGKPGMLVHGVAMRPFDAYRSGGSEWKTYSLIAGLSRFCLYRLPRICPINSKSPARNEFVASTYC